MMLENSFWIKEWKLLKRRGALVFFTIGVLIFLLPFATVMTIVRSDQVCRASEYNEVMIKLMRVYEVNQVLGIEHLWPVMIIGLAVIIGIRSFAWLFSAEKVDFYESQPETRKERYWLFYINGIVMFVVPFIVLYAISIGLAFLMDGLTKSVLAAIIFEALRIFGVYFATYSLSVASVMLTGNAIFALCGVGFFLCVEMVFSFLYSMFASTFFATYMWSSSVSKKIILSPLYGYINEFACLEVNNNIYFGDNYMRPKAMILETIRELLPETVVFFAIGIIVMFIALYLYQKRQAETAGSTVIHKPVRIISRLIVSWLGALGCMLVFMLWMMDRSVAGTGMMICMCVIAAIIAIVLSGIVESLFEADIKKFFKNYWVTAAAIVLSCVYIFVFGLDLIGFDSYIPKASAVKDAVLINDGNENMTYTDENGLSDQMEKQAYIEKYMHITDVEAMQKIAEAGQSHMRETFHSDFDESTGWYSELIWNMKDGRKIHRQLYIPYDIDENVMDQVVGSDAYCRAYFPIFNDGYFEKNKKRYNIFYSNGADVTETDGEKYTEFADAYRKDVEENYDFTLARDEYPVGEINIGGKDNWGLSESYTVYKGYKNTIAFLNKNNMWLDPIDEVTDVTKLTISGYIDDVGEYRDVDFEDPDEIKEILKNTVMSAYNSEWKKASDYDYDFSVEVETDKRKPDGCMTAAGLFFRNGDVPQDILARLIDEGQLVETSGDEIVY